MWNVSPHNPSETNQQLGEFLRQLRRLVLDEADSVRQQLFQIWSRPLATRVAEGHAIEGVRVVQVEPSGMITLACDRNASRFREGDVLLLNRGDPFADPQLLVTLELDDETELLVSTDDPAANWGSILDERGGWVLDQGLIDFSQYVLDALDQAGDTAIGRERVLPLLLGRARPTMDLARYERAFARGEDWGLNDMQCEALAQAYATSLTYLTQGPPGTGKTLVLARLAQLLAEDGERVLITAFTHRAINNALNKLAELDRRMDAAPVSCCKIGRQTRADDLDGVENYETFELSPLTELSGGYVVGATPFATRTQRLSGVEFDTVIFDESSQITLPLAVMGMLTAKRFVFIGDFEARYHRLTSGDAIVEWRTFHGWCQAHWPAGERVPRPIGEQRRAPLLTPAWRKQLAGTAISERMFQEEVDWFKDRLLNTRAEYLGADRSGRGFGLSEVQRGRVVDAITAYRRLCKNDNLFTSKTIQHKKGTPGSASCSGSTELGVARRRRHHRKRGVTAMDIFIIDDNTSHLQMLTTFLETLGYRVATAADGQDALTQLHQATERPNLIIADVAMPHMTGWEFVRAQQSDAGLAAIPVVMMTALGYFDAEVDTASVVDYLEKPLDLAALELVVRAYAVPRYDSRAAGV